MTNPQPNQSRAATLAQNNQLTNESPTRIGVLKSYLRFAMPMTIAMLLNGLYNLVDAYFIANYVGENAFAAVSTIFPFQLFIVACALLISNGVSIMVSQFFGANKKEQAQNVVSSASALIVIVSIVVACLAHVSGEEIMLLLGVTSVLENDASHYFYPIAYSAVLILTLSLLSDILRAQANMAGLFLIILVGALCNIALDYLFIVLLNLQVMGAALATIIGQSIGIVLGIWFIKKESGQLSLELGKLVLKLRLTSQFLAVGLPTFLTYLGGVIVMITINWMIANTASLDSEMTLAAYGIIGRLNIFIILPLIAISQACQTLVAYNHGARETLQVRYSTQVGIFLATLYLSLISLILFMFPSQIAGVFTDKLNLISYTREIGSITFMLLPLAGLSVITLATFQATGKAKAATYLSTIKVYGLVLPMLWLLKSNFTVDYIWYAFPIAECMILLFIISAWALTETSSSFAQVTTTEQQR